MTQLRAFVSENSWSYIINEKGNAKRITFVGYGSCTPIEVLQAWIDNMSESLKSKESASCDLTQDMID